MKIYSTLSDIRSVPVAGASGPVRINIPCVGRVHNIKIIVNKGTGGTLATPAEMIAAIGEIRLILDTYTHRRIKLGEYFALLQANGVILENGFLPVYFTEPWRATTLDEEKTALALGGRYSQAAVEFDIVQPASPNHLSFEAKYEFDYLEKTMPDGTQLRGIIGHVAQTETPGTGQPIITLNKDVGNIQRLFLNAPATLVIERVQVLVGESVVFDRFNTAARPEIKHQLKDMGMALPTNYTIGGVVTQCVPVLFDNNQQFRDSFPANARLQLTTSGTAGTIRIVAETRVAA